MKLAVIVTVVLALVLGTVVVAGENPNAKVAVHILPRDPDRGCDRNFPRILEASDLITTHPGCGQVDFFPVFFDLKECLCVEYGVLWTDWASCVFTICSYAHIGEVQWPGDGISHCWGECQPGPAVIPGWGWMTVDGPGRICVVSHPVPGEISIADCHPDIQIDHPVKSFCAGYCGAKGDNDFDWLVLATESTTWGSIKGMFK
jgi:hypothetical protein